MSHVLPEKSELFYQDDFSRRLLHKVRLSGNNVTSDILDMFRERLRVDKEGRLCAPKSFRVPKVMINVVKHNRQPRQAAKLGVKYNCSITMSYYDMPKPNKGESFRVPKGMINVALKHNRQPRRAAKLGVKYNCPITMSYYDMPNKRGVEKR
jgi:hypothetical protein